MPDHTDSMGALALSLAKAQAKFGPVKRDKKVVVKTKTGGSYEFAYAPLDSILEAVRKPLADNGLVVVQLLDDGALVTMLLHESGARISGSVSLPDGGDIQGFGSAITYLRRYAIQALLGIAAEDDDDGNRAAGNDVAKPEVAGGETLEVLGNLAKSGTIVAGGASAYKLDWRETPEGHAIGFRLKLTDGKDVPQVLVAGPIGEALYLAHPDGKALDGMHVSLRGKLYSVRQPGRAGYYRLVIGPADGDFIETPDVRIPALETAPAPEERPEAPSEPLPFDMAEIDAEVVA